MIRRLGPSIFHFVFLCLMAGISVLCGVQAASLIAQGKDTVVEQGTFPLPGEWACDRRDGSRQARSPLKGQILRPRSVGNILWVRCAPTWQSRPANRLNSIR